MRNILIKAMAVVAIAGAPALASAQQTDADAQRAAEVADREDRGEWGWLVSYSDLLACLGLSAGIRWIDKTHAGARVPPASNDVRGSRRRSPALAPADPCTSENFHDPGTVRRSRHAVSQQRFTWRELAGKPISKLDDDAFTRVRVILMNGIEMEALRFSTQPRA